MVCATSKSDQSLCWSLEYSLIVKLLTEQHMEFLSLTGGCTGSSESNHVKMPHFWKSYIVAKIISTLQAIVQKWGQVSVKHENFFTTLASTITPFSSKIFNLACAPIKDSDQPAQMPRLIRVYGWHSRTLRVVKSSLFLQAEN